VPSKCWRALSANFGSTDKKLKEAGFGSRSYR
jgi:hypothetical protein